MSGCTDRTRLARGEAVSAGGSRPHIDALDVVRPLAALAVITTHATESAGYSTSAFYGAVLVESHASRHIFFFVAAMVLTYQAYARPRWSPLDFWRRRFLSVCVPYLLWTVIYFLLGFTAMRGLAIYPVSGSPLDALMKLGTLIVRGPGQLYFIMVLVQFYILFPAFLWLLERTRGHHLIVVAVSLVIEVVMLTGIMHFGFNRYIFLNINATREITSYVFYLVAGGVVGANFPEVQRWVWRHRAVLAAAIVAVAICSEAYYALRLHGGASPQAAAATFAPGYLPSYTAGILALYLAGAWWAARQRDGWFSRLIRASSDNSYGVFLSHAVFLDLAVSLGLGDLKPGIPWYFVVLIALAVSWTGATIVTVAAARTPVGAWLVGRARRPVFGGPPPVGRGTKGWHWPESRAAAAQHAAAGGEAV